MGIILKEVGLVPVLVTMDIRNNMEEPGVMDIMDHLEEPGVEATMVRLEGITDSPMVIQGTPRTHMEVSVVIILPRVTEALVEVSADLEGIEVDSEVMEEWEDLEVIISFSYQ